MREKIGPLTERETIIGDLRVRLKGLLTKGPNNPETNLLQKALKLERFVERSKGEESTSMFPTGYAGRKGIVWHFGNESWYGCLYNRESGIVKKESTGKTAEEMLRELMLTK